MTDEKRKSDTPKHRKRPRDWTAVVERAIREAQERGEFDNLEGEGKPLRWDDERVPPEQRMANKVLKNAGYAPAWIEDDKWIRAERKAVRKLLDDFADWYRRELAALAGETEAKREERLRELAWMRDMRIREYRERSAKLNERIDKFNLTVPISRLQWHRVRTQKEITAFRRLLEEIELNSRKTG